MSLVVDFRITGEPIEMGYFDESKRVTHSEIADELGISRSSLSERLRRAEHELVQERLGASD